MYIQTEDTPNPNTLKFITGGDLLKGSNPLMIGSAKEAEDQSLLALSIFAVTGISSVFIARDFVSISKENEESWDNLKAPLLAVMLEHFNLNKPILVKRQPEDQEEVKEFFNKEDSEKVDKIRTLIDEKVRPVVAQDGGDIVFRGFEEGIVYLSLKGACAGCPISSVTLKNGIENMLKYYVEGIKEVKEII